MTGAEKINAKRYEAVSNRLNHDTYLAQLKENGGRPLKHFFPCQKALVFTKALSESPIPVSSVVVYEAAETLCNCHPALTQKDLFGMLTQ